MDATEFEDAYLDRLPVVTALGVTVERILKELVADAGITTLSISHRVKTRDSALRKFAKRPQWTGFDDMTDVLGLRIITYLKDEVDAVARVVESEFDLDAENSVDKRAILDPDRFGYLSLHYVARLSPGRAAITEYKKFEGQRFEIQIRSILQHAWAEIEHDLGYKTTSAVPRDERRAFSRLAGLLEIADDEFVRIRDRLDEHQRSTESEIARGGRDIEIDQDSVFALVQADEPTVQRIDLAIARYALGPEGANAEPARTYAGARATELRKHGYRTIDEALQALAHNETAVLKFARHWLHAEFPAAENLPPEEPFRDDEDELEEVDEVETDWFDDELGASEDVDFEFRGPTVVFRSTPESLRSLNWPKGVSLFYLHQYLVADAALSKFSEASGWDRDTDPLERALGACLAAARELPPVPLS